MVVKWSKRGLMVLGAVTLGVVVYEYLLGPEQ